MVDITRRGFVAAGAASMAALALSPSISVFDQANADEEEIIEVVPGCCHSCHYGPCTHLYTMTNGVLTGVEGDPDGPYNQGKICLRGLGVANYVYNPYRVTSPLMRTNPEKGLDVDPEWREVSWDEAIETLTEKLRAIHDDDPRKLMWIGGFPTCLINYSSVMFPTAFGTPNSENAQGNMCSVHLSNGLVHQAHVQFPDYNYCDYVIAIGGTVGPNHAGADGECTAYADMLEEGTRFIHVDPFCTQEASMGEWVPIKPGTDLPYVLALGNVLLYERGELDEWFLKNRTNASYLINAEGNDYVRDPETNKPLVWNVEIGQAVPFDSDWSDCALEGVFEVNGQKATTGFTLVKEAYKDFTPEWAEEICTVPAEDIREHANGLVDAASIGETIDINGTTLPYRPACVYVERGLCNHYDGHMAMWAAMLLNEMIGAVGVPGGNISFNAKPTQTEPDEDGVVIPSSQGSAWHKFQMPPKEIYANEFMPFAYDYSPNWVNVMKDPDAYGMDYLPEMLISAGTNFFTKGSADVEGISDALRALDYVVTASYHLDEMAMFADLVLPDRTYLEQPICYDFMALRPGGENKRWVARGNDTIVEPIHDGPILEDMWIDIAEDLGILYGPGHLNFLVNKRRQINGPEALDLKTKYTSAEIIDHGLRSHSGMGLDEFAEVGYAEVVVPPEQAYTYTNFPGRQTHHPFYNLLFKQAGEGLLNGLKAAGMKHPGGIEEDIEFYYQGVPVYKPTPTQAGYPEEFDLLGTVRRSPQIMFDLGAVTSNPWILETSKQNPQYGSWLINPVTAARKGLQDGDLIMVEGQYGGEVGPYPVKLTELIHPDALGVLGGFGRKKAGMNPIVEDGIPYNLLLPMGWETNDIFTGGVELSPRLKITKA